MAYDIDELGMAIHAAKRIGGPWGPPCGHPLYPNDPSKNNPRTDWVLVEYNDNSNGEFDCDCGPMAHHLIEIIEAQRAKRTA